MRSDSIVRDADTLKGLQDDLLGHFGSLATVRQSSGFPIFALEHGLDTAQLQRVNTLLRKRQNSRLRSAPFWLLWAVYTAEAGYDYTGDEYWPSFESRTPNWQFHDRPKVKAWLRKFQQSFNGVTPSGPWAEHFSIIAWPITHALLPRYLQHQFAKLLYDLRFRLASASLDAGSIGRLLAAHASHVSTRFQAFLEQEELTGQIVAALLKGESVDADDLIHPATLDRLVTDLGRVRSSREWLKETRRVVSDRFKGIGRGTYRHFPPPKAALPGESVLQDPMRFAIRPELFLRHGGNGKWAVLLQLRSLRPLAAENAALRLFLDRTRCRLAGATDWKPTGWLLSGNRMGALGHWPESDGPLVRFERPDPLMDHLLESEFRLPPGPIWLFRVGKDGIGRHIASRTVRPAGDYVVVTAIDFPQDVRGLTHCSLDCQGVRGFRLAVPNQVSADATRRLRDLGIDVARTIRVWPAGLPGRGWDGDGRTEWLTTESPCFGIASDHPIDRLSFHLDDRAEQVIPTVPSGAPTFVRLPPLAAGIHSLTVEAHRSPDLNRAVATPPAKGFAQLTVREPEPWTPGVASHPGLIVTSDPFGASLDILWRNEIHLTVNGPEGFSVSVRLTLHTTDDRQVLSDIVDHSMPLPITPDAWRRTFAHFLNNEARAWKYLEAASCTLQIHGEHLGTCELRFDHSTSPLRWALASRQRETLVHLVDDTGQHETAPEVEFFSMDQPLAAIPMEPESARSDLTVPPPGGLYVARNRPFEDSAVVSAPPTGLKDIGVEPHAHVAEGAPAILDACRLLHLWCNARQAGFLADVRRRQVTRCIFNAIFRSICGENWGRAEECFREGHLSQATLTALESLVDRRSDFGKRLSRQSNAEGDSTPIFAAEARRCGVSANHDLCRFALAFASRQPNVIVDLDLVGQLVDQPALLRGARLMSRLRERNHAQPPASPRPGRPQ